MLHFIFQKIRSKKWMVISLLLGNLLMVAIAAVSPMYSKAALQRTLTRNLSNYLVETNKNPGTIVAQGSFRKNSAGNTSKAYQKLEDGKQLFEQLIQELSMVP